ncbi:MAG: hypothetical protein IJN59_03825 [Oscillospiraceae bacterium]|nr:hypothetical protein [Oscillospiraceae bacterium]
MHIIMDLALRQDFVSRLSAYADTPLHISCDEHSIYTDGIDHSISAYILSRSSFILWERKLLRRMIKKYVSCFSEQQKQRLFDLALRLLDNDLPRGGEFSGPHRLERIEARIKALLNCCDHFHFEGFCRFVLYGHISYLHFIIERAADELLAEEEQQQYIRLLQSSCQNKRRKSKKELRLFFSEDNICQIWESSEHGIKLKEGGRIKNNEDMFIAMLIARQPSRLVIEGAQNAPTPIIDLLQQIFSLQPQNEAGKLILDNALVK